MTLSFCGLLSVPVISLPSTVDRSHRYPENPKWLDGPHPSFELDRLETTPDRRLRWNALRARMGRLEYVPRLMSCNKLPRTNSTNGKEFALDVLEDQSERSSLVRKAVVAGRKLATHHLVRIIGHRDESDKAFYSSSPSENRSACRRR